MSEWCPFSVCISIYIFFIHSSLAGQLGCSHVLAIVIFAAMNTGVHLSFQGNFFFPGICSGLGLLDHMETLFLLFLRKCPTVFHSGCTSLHSPNSVNGFPSSPHALQHVIHQLSNDGHFDRYEVVPHCSVYLPSLLISNAEHLFICLLAICISCFKPQTSIMRVTSMDSV